MRTHTICEFGSVSRLEVVVWRRVIFVDNTYRTRSMSDFFAALAEAARRTGKWSREMLRGGRDSLWGRAANIIRENSGLLLLGIGVSAIVGWDYLSVSMSMASASLVVLEGDVILVSRLLKFTRLFATPIDELFIGSILTVFFVIALLDSGWSYFKSQLEQLR